MQLEVGKRYRNSFGDEYEIVSRVHPSEGMTLFVDQSGAWYNPDGTWWDDNGEIASRTSGHLDLIEEVSE